MLKVGPGLKESCEPRWWRQWQQARRFSGGYAGGWGGVGLPAALRIFKSKGSYMGMSSLGGVPKTTWWFCFQTDKPRAASNKKTLKCQWDELLSLPLQRPLCRFNHPRCHAAAVRRETRVAGFGKSRASNFWSERLLLEGQFADPRGVPTILLRG